MKKANERRDTPRFRVRGTGVYIRKHKMFSRSKAVFTRVRDLSPTGLSLLVSEKYEIGEKVEMTIELPGRDKFSVNGIVRKYEPQENLFLLGVQFGRLSEKYKQLLSLRNLHSLAEKHDKNEAPVKSELTQIDFAKAQMTKIVSVLVVTPKRSFANTLGDFFYDTKFSCCGWAPDVATGLLMVRRTKPDVVMMETKFPKGMFDTSLGLEHLIDCCEKIEMPPKIVFLDSNEEDICHSTSINKSDPILPYCAESEKTLQLLNSVCFDNDDNLSRVKRRRKFKIPISLTGKFVTGRKLNSVTSDLSVMGCSMETSVRFDVGSVVQSRLEFVDGDIMCFASVRRCRAIENGHGYDLGLSFSEMSNDDIKKLERLVND